MEFERPETVVSLAAQHKAARLVELAEHAQERAQALIVRSARARHHRFSAPALYPEDVTATAHATGPGHLRVDRAGPRGMVAGDPGE